jgi:hypothetical protein
MKKVTCPKCNETYNLGYNGVIEGCDKCIGIKRDKQGHAWFKGETSHTYKPNNGGPEYNVTRKKAFSDRAG